MPMTKEQYRRRVFRRALTQRRAGGISAIFVGQDERQVLRELLGHETGHADLLENPEFQRQLVHRILLRHIADPKISIKEQRLSAMALVELEGLNKASKVAEVERQIREVRERLQRDDEILDVTPAKAH